MSKGLVIQSVAKIFPHPSGEVRAVDDVSLHIRENEFFTLLGPSGCGKTTLLRLVAGLETADSGQIILDGADIAPLPAHRRPVNTVFQSYALFPHMTVAGNISFGLKMQKKPQDDIDAALKEALRLVRLEDLGDRKPAELSGGQQQRVALARALVNHPKVLLLDESLSALDYKLRCEMRLELKRLQRDTGITFIFVTHDQDEALSMSDRIAVMEKGKVAQLGTPQEIYGRPATRFVADFIGTCNFVRGQSLGLKEAGDVGFRPEDVRLSSPAEGEWVSARGKLLHVVYGGAVTQGLVRLDSGENVTIELDHPQAANIDAPVHVFVPAGKLIRCGT